MAAATIAVFPPAKNPQILLCRDRGSPQPLSHTAGTPCWGMDVRVWEGMMPWGGQGVRQCQMRAAHCKLGMTIIVLCLSFPTGLWRSKCFLWGSCKTTRQAEEEGQGYTALSLPWGLGRGEMGPQGGTEVSRQ